MIKFKRFSMEGVFSYGKCDIDFSPGLVLLEGKNYDEGDNVSNMAGKTSLFDGITTCLFEQNSKNAVKDDLCNKILGNGQAYIGVELEVQGKNIEINYSRAKGKGNWVVSENGIVVEKGVREMKKYVSDLLEMDYNMFVMSSYMEQGRLNKFVGMDDSERKKLVNSYFGLNKSDFIRNKVKEVKRPVIDELISLEAQINQLNKIDISNNDLETELKKLEIFVDKYKDNSPVRLEDYRAERKSYFFKLEMQLQKGILLDSLNKDKIAMAEIDGKMNWCKEVALKLGDNKCYVCGTVIDGKKFKEEALSTLEFLKDKRKELSVNVGVVEKVLYSLGDWNRERKLKELVKCRMRVGNVTEYRESLTQIGNLKQQIEMQEKREKMLSGLVEQCEVQKGMQSALDFWFDGFGPKGIPAMVTQQLLSGLNSCINSYSGRFGWHVNCIMDNDKMVLDVQDKWKQLKAGYFSGSENVLISMFMSLGLWDWLNYRGKGTNILLLDEVFAAFDITMRSRMVELVQEIAKDRCVILITHNEDVKNLVNFDRIWLVEKKNGISNLKVY